MQRAFFAGCAGVRPTVNGESSPIQALAAAAITGTLDRIEEWVDGVKQYAETASKTLSTSREGTPGAHEFDFYAVNTAGTKWDTIFHTTVY
jgi:hypothetical protein